MHTHAHTMITAEAGEVVSKAAAPTPHAVALPLPPHAATTDPGLATASQPPPPPLLAPAHTFVQHSLADRGAAAQEGGLTVGNTAADAPAVTGFPSASPSPMPSPRSHGLFGSSGGPSSGGGGGGGGTKN